VLEIINLKK